MKKRTNETYDEFRKRYVIATLRKASLYWPARTEAKNKARRARGLYECYICHNLFKNGEFELDHISPVIHTLSGFTTLDEYSTRLLCEPDNFAVCCIKCHEVKTSIENETRNSVSKKKKELDKKIKKAAKK